MHRRTFGHAIGSALVAAFLTIFFAACLSFGDLSGGTGSNGDASTPSTFSIGGTISGLEGASVSLVDNGADGITVSADGTFVFPTKLASGASYAVSVSTPPAKHICAVQNGNGVATADVTNILVSCPSTSVTLSSLSLSNGTIAPAFSAAVLSYSATVSALIFSPSTTVTAQAASPGAMIAIDGKPATAGTATVDVAIATTPRPIAIVVTSADGSSTSTTIVTVQAGNEQTAYLKASNTSGGRNFGAAVAISADGTTMAIGAQNESSGATGVNDPTPNIQYDTSQSGAGAVYVFAKTGGTWTQTAYVKASNTRANSNFGASVSLSDDGTVLAVGASFESSAATGVNNTNPGQSDTSAGGAGAVFIFVNIGGTWSQTAYVKPASTHAGNRFGNAVSLSGSGTSLAVASYLEQSGSVGINGDETDTTANGAGAVYLFENNSGWSQTTYFKASNANEGKRFGQSMALSGDGSSLVVGAPTENSASTGVNSTTPGQNDTSVANAGAAYIFAKSGAAWSQTAYVKSSNTRANAYFGSSVTVSTDGSTVAIGATSESSAATGVNNTSPGQGDTSAAMAGAVYVFEKTASWTQTAYVKASNTRANASFGSSVALSGDATRLAIGATGESSGSTGIDGDQTNTSATNAGAEYVFLKGAPGWAQTAYVKASNNRASAAFGKGAALSRDGASLVVGAIGESSAAKGVNGTSPGQDDTSAAAAGAAYLFQ